jgi:hypothetical protein
MFASLQVLSLRVLLVAGLIAVTSLSISQVASASTAATTPTYSSAQMVTISDTAPNAIIYYTTNGTMPTTASSVYSAPITISSTETLEAIATIGGCSGCLTSAVVTAGYFITPLAVGGALGCCLKSALTLAEQNLYLIDTGQRSIIIVGIVGYSVEIVLDYLA